MTFSWLQHIIMATDDPIMLRWQVIITKRWSFYRYQLEIIKKTVEPKLTVAAEHDQIYQDAKAVNDDTSEESMMTEDEVQVVTMKLADKNDDSERTSYRKVSQDHNVVTEATADFNKIKKEKIPQQHIANDHEDETGGEKVEPGVQCSGGLMNSLSSAQPED